MLTYMVMNAVYARHVIAPIHAATYTPPRGDKVFMTEKLATVQHHTALQIQTNSNRLRPTRQPMNTTQHYKSSTSNTPANEYHTALHIVYVQHITQHRVNDSRQKHPLPTTYTPSNKITFRWNTKSTQPKAPKPKAPKPEAPKSTQKHQKAPKSTQTRSTHTTQHRVNDSRHTHHTA